MEVGHFGERCLQGVDPSTQFFHYSSQYSHRPAQTNPMAFDSSRKRRGKFGCFSCNTKSNLGLHYNELHPGGLNLFFPFLSPT